MALFCPVTGLSIYTNPAWIKQKVSDSLTANFWILDSSIIYSLPTGYADLDGVRNSLELNAEVADSVLETNHAYVQIEDYAFLNGSSSEARNFFSSRMEHNKAITALIFCNLSVPLSIAVKFGRRFNPSGKRIQVTGTYADAVRSAIEFSGPKRQKPADAPIDLSSFIDGENRSLSPVELHVNPAWDIETAEYANQAVVVNHSILHSISRGCLKSNHIPLIERMRNLCSSSLPTGSTIDYIVVDAARLKGGSRSARAKYMQSLKSWHNRFPIRMYIVYGANTFMKTALHLARPLMPFKVRIAKDLNHALKLIGNEKSGKSSNRLKFQNIEKPAVVSQHDIDNLIGLIGSINWEREGIDGRFEIAKNHPFYFLYQSIKLIKEELDDLFKQRDRLEEHLHQSRKMESIGTLAGGIAHDFNNLLYILLANAELAMDKLSERHPSFTHLEEIKTTSLKAADIVRQLLNYSRKNNPELKPTDVVSAVKDVIKLLRSSIPSTIEICKHLPVAEIVVLCDPTQFGQVLLNICTNASQAMEEKGGVLEISIKTAVIDTQDVKKYVDLKPGNYVKISVSDTGTGIDPEILDRIFDPYFTTKKIGKGTGMGLSVAMGILKKHDGTITVDSRWGKGTNFNIFLPMVAKKPEVHGKTVDKNHNGRETILFVDDEKPIAETSQMMLQKLGYKVESKTNPLEALTLFESKFNEIDLVITDMTMPHMTGIMLSERLMEIQPAIPIIICSGHNSPIDDKKAKELGISAYVMKPYAMPQMAKTIREVLNSNDSSDPVLDQC